MQKKREREPIDTLPVLASPTVQAILEAAAIGNVTVGGWTSYGAGYLMAVGYYEIRINKEGRLNGYWISSAGIDGRDCRGNDWLARICAMLATRAKPEATGTKALSTVGLQEDYYWNPNPSVAQIRQALATYTAARIGED